jgi:glycosyltransferase involved in cell wall biosynthesis
MTQSNSATSKSGFTSIPKRLKITLLGHEAALDLILTGRPRSIATILKRQFEVELVTPIFPYNQIEDYDLSEVPVTWRYVRAGGYPRFFSDTKKLLDNINGDIIYALKPRPASYGLALLSQRRRERPVLLDVDDWEKSMCYPYSKYLLKNVVASIPELNRPNSYLYTAALENLVGMADALTCVSNFFLQRYGGELLPNGCNTVIYDPARFDRKALREQYDIDRYKVIMFVGTVQPHKGLSELIKALDLINRPDLRLIIVGPKTAFLEQLLNKSPKVIYWGFHPPSHVPELLSMADMIVLPQVKGAQARGQMPLKLFQAMSMALPIISTPQADIGEVLEGCGLLAPTSNPDDLAQKIEYLLANPEEAQHLGWLARRKCLHFYSWDAMELVLDKVLAPFI